MQKRELAKVFLTRENFYRLATLMFGLTLFPGIVHLSSKILITSTTTISGFYLNFYASLLDMGKDGLVAWGIACAPYMAYEISLLVRTLRTDKSMTARKEDQE